MTLDFSPGDLVKLREREWVVTQGGENRLTVRPLSGSDAEAITVDPRIEISEIKPATFDLPDTEQLGRQEDAQLLADATRLALRRGAGPFRSAASLGVDPRAYQLVPLMMALRQLPDAVRLLIADDVGVGKTIESGMILRELVDRGEIMRFCVLCPPHLVDQWCAELSEKFDFDAVPVTSARARSLERGLAVDESLFDVHPWTVVSLDYIKNDRRRADFLRVCPECVVVDEAHTCVGVSGADRTQQRYALLRDIASDESRYLLLLTATPHSGDTGAFNRLVGLIATELEGGPPALGNNNARERYFRKLAQHFVQRRRNDISEWNEVRAFPEVLKTDVDYRLTGAHADFQDAVLDYSLASMRGEHGRRTHYWTTLALMRCVGSSPAAAAAALRNRRLGQADTQALSPVIMDAEDGLFDDSDIEPATGLGATTDPELDALIKQAETLEALRNGDPKLLKLMSILKPLQTEAKANTIVFCRFIATARHVGEALQRAYPKTNVRVITGEYAPEERRARVEEMGEAKSRILVATDCLSEGINLQQNFNAVVHYDLCWNPTRHQQREGRVNRFGQPAPTVYLATLYGSNSPIDSAVLNVILRKAAEIEKATGVAVPLPDDADTVAGALMAAVRGRAASAIQGDLDFGETEADRQAREQLDLFWKGAAKTQEEAKASRSRYAQRALKPEDVTPEWERIRALNGGPKEVERFVRRASARLGAPLGTKHDRPLISLNELPTALQEHLAARGLKGDRCVEFADRPSLGAMHVGRTHPITAQLANHLAEGALDPKRPQSNRVARSAVWKSSGVEVMMTVLLLRLRCRIRSGRHQRSSLAEEVSALAFAGLDSIASIEGDDALALLELSASGNILDTVRRTRVSIALEQVESRRAALDDFARKRAAELKSDHLRFAQASDREGRARIIEVTPALPPDVLGLYVILPEIGE